MADDGGFSSLSAIDQLKLTRELFAKAEVPPEEAAAAQKRNLRDLMSVIPGPGNIIAAEDAYSGAGDAVGAFKAGNYGQSALHGVAAALSGLGAVTGLPTSRMAGDVAKGGKDTLNIFAGPTAKTADLGKLEIAKQLEKAGTDPKRIWMDTDWTRGPDGGWRFEIDDSAAKMRGSAGKLGDALDHPELFKAYPDLAGVDVRPKLDSGAAYGKPGLFQREHIETTREPDIGSVLHEVQHGVQRREGFSDGANFSGAVDARPQAELDTIRGRLKADMAAILSDPHASLQDGAADKVATMAYASGTADMSKGASPYFRNAGEVEARNVEARRTMPPGQRWKTHPSETQDIPDYAQVTKAPPSFIDGIKGLFGSGDKKQIFAGDTQDVPIELQIAKALRPRR